MITDSFHGCIFSILFNKPFIVIRNEHRGMSRFYSLLNQFNLCECLVSDGINIPTDWDWENVNKIIEKKRGDAARFLRKYININNEE